MAHAGTVTPPLHDSKTHHERAFSPLLTLEEFIEHCIELLRQAVICKGDTSVTSFKWLRNTSEPTTKEGVLHQCVNWEQLNGWAKERSSYKEGED